MPVTLPVDVQNSTAELPIADFIDLLKSKDIQAFKKLYDDYSGALYALIVRSTNDKILAQDILQNVFLKIWMNIEGYNPDKSRLYTWMMTIARNEIVDYYRLSSSKKRTVIKTYAIEFTHGPEQEVSNKIDVTSLLKDLNARQKLMFDLLYFKGYTFNETAKVLCMPTGTVKTQVRSILKKWRPTFNILYQV